MWRLFMMTTTFKKSWAKGIRATARKTLLGKVWQKGYALSRVKYKNKYKIIILFYIYLCVILFFIYVLFCHTFPKSVFLTKPLKSRLQAQVKQMDFCYIKRKRDINCNIQPHLPLFIQLIRNEIAKNDIPH